MLCYGCVYHRYADLLLHIMKHLQSLTASMTCARSLFGVLLTPAYSSAVMAHSTSGGNRNGNGNGKRTAMTDLITKSVHAAYRLRRLFIDQIELRFAYVCHYLLDCDQGTAMKATPEMMSEVMLAMTDRYGSTYVAPNEISEQVNQQHRALLTLMAECCRRYVIPSRTLVTTVAIAFARIDDINTMRHASLDGESSSSLSSRSSSIGSSSSLLPLILTPQLEHAIELVVKLVDTLRGCIAWATTPITIYSSTVGGDSKEDGSDTPRVPAVMVNQPPRYLDDLLSTLHQRLQQCQSGAPSRLRFMVMDVIEAYQRDWKRRERRTT